MRMELIIRFDYGSIVPWVHRRNGALQATAGPNTPVAVHHNDGGGVFGAGGDSLLPQLSPSHDKAQPAVIPERALAAQRKWRTWSGRSPPWQ